MSEPLTDSVLVLRAGRGDAIAFSELVTRHYRRALRVAYGLLRRRAEAEAVVQEAFARLHPRLGKLVGAAMFYAWLYRLVVVLCGQQTRSAGGATADETAGREPLAGVALPHGAVLMLRELEGFSYDEIAVILQISRASVVRRLVSARLALQAQLGAPACAERCAAPDGGA